jgi:hypothetical protein
MTFVTRRINLKFSLGTGNFGESGADTIDLEGLRVAASITKGGGVFMSELNMRVFGMSLDVMNKLSILGKPLTTARRNTVTVSAGDDDSGVAVVFTGTITECWVDTRSMPQVSLIVVAHAGYMTAMKPVPPTSYKGSVDAALVVAGIAAQMPPEGATENENGEIATGMIFENSGVDVQISNPYLAGTYFEQLQTIARAGDFNCVIDNDTVAIWPAGGSRKGSAPVISPETGMVGYPNYTQNGIQLKTLFNPSIVFQSPVEVKSELTPANGTWVPYIVTHELESEMPNGQWFTLMECNLTGQETVVG